MKDILERLKSPVIWIAFLTCSYTFIEMTDFSDPKEIVLGAITLLITFFSALNNPTDRDNM